MRKKEGDGADSRNEGEGCQPIDSEPDEQLREMAGVICGIPECWMRQFGPDVVGALTRNGMAAFVEDVIIMRAGCSKL